MKLTDLLSVLPFYTTESELSDIWINAIEDDSRHVSNGALFVCIKGYTVDGHDFIEQAAARGSAAILAERKIETSIPVIYVKDMPRAMAMVAAKFYNYPTNRLSVVGVTGTNGKTTVTYLLEAIFAQYGMKTGIIGTNQLKVGNDSFSIDNTTPNALFLQKIFYDMQQNGVDAVVMEVSSHALDMGRVYGTTYAAAVFTNLSRDHLDYHTTMSDYRHAKSLLFAQLGNDYEHSNPPLAILNQDDPAYSFMNKSTSQPVLSYSRDQLSDLWASDIELTSSGTTFNMHVGSSSIPIYSQLIGSFNVSNILAASGAALAFQMPLDIIQRALENVTYISGRFERVTDSQPYEVIVDYAHTPDSLENVLETLKQLANGRIIVVVGCGGDRDTAKRPLMAQTALAYADWCVFTSDNPRTEKAQMIIDDMTSNLDNDTHYTVMVDREQAIRHAIDMAVSDDIILIAGKGHETHQDIDHIKYPFDDRQVAQQAINNKET